jgi:hypothetical protein
MIIRLALLLLFIPQTDSQLIQEISASGRCADLGDLSSGPIAPGPPPLLSFRYYEGIQHHRFGNSELMLDDAGH